MNLIKDITARIEARAAEVKTLDIKSYATYERAESEAEKQITRAATHFDAPEYAKQFVIIEVAGRFFPALNINLIIANGKGGYAGICAEAGFICY